MSAHSVEELRAFHQFVGDKVNDGGSSLSPEDVLDEWRTIHPEAKASAEEIAAIQEAIPFDDFDRDFRARHNLPPLRIRGPGQPPLRLRDIPTN
jgi:hypothetical protein